MRQRRRSQWLGAGLACALSAALAADDALDAPNAAPEPAVDRAAKLDAVEVRATGMANDWPDALATDLLDPSRAVAAAVDFQDLVVRRPGVDATGQNGLFETFSIRGLGGNGILILLGGMPLSAQRRAGVPVSFVEPALLGEVALTRGPAVVHYGPGALGGAVSIAPRWFSEPTASLGYADNGNESRLMAATGTAAFSLAVARHRADDSVAADGSALNTRFARDSGSLQYRTQWGDLDVDVLLLPSRSVDIGKSNSRFPERVTRYPIDRHLVGRLRLQHGNGVSVSVHGHEQRLETHNRRTGSPDTLASIGSRDLGATLQREFGAGDVAFDLGLEWFGRRQVSGFDAVGSRGNRRYSLDGAREDVGSLFMLADWAAAPALQVELGVRASHLAQVQQGAASSDSAAAFTLGAVWAAGEGARWSASLSSGYRFATLEERFFSGVTAQGGIVGNPDLGAEQSLGLDLGHAWRRGQWGGAIHVWQTDVDDLIQFVALGPEVDGYLNVGRARLYGAEASFDWQPDARLDLRAGAAFTRSRDRATGEPLYGVGPPSFSLELGYTLAAARLGVHYSHRARMDRPGFEEVARGAVDQVDLDLRYPLGRQWDLQVTVRNALDRRYFATADALSTLAPGRSLGVALVWRGR